MSLSSTSINRPVFATVMSIFIVILGAISYTFLGVRDYPSVDSPIISVSTSFPGANADVIDNQITEILESAINGIPGIKSISSTSRDGSSRITIEFNLDVDLETAANDVRNKVSGVQRRLPADVDPPSVSKADADAQPIFTITVESDARSLIDLSEFAEVNVKERLQTITGVSSVDIWGSRRFSIRMKMDPQLLAAYGITPLDVRNAISRENVELPAGRIEGANTELSIRTLGRLRTVEDFNNLSIINDNDRVVRFRDIGEAVVDAENTRSAFRRNGKPMVSAVIIPQPGANYIDIADQAYKVLEQLKKDLPEDVKLNVSMDKTKYIRESITEVADSIIIAFILVVLIIFLFLRSWRTTLIPVLAIPISLIGTFFIMYVLNFSVNILTLLAIVLAIGLVVDDAIVMMENIFAKIEQGMSPKEAALSGSKEIFFAVIATTVALVAVFFPIVFLQGVTGRLFREFSMVIAGAVIISTFVALSFTPMISMKILTVNATNNRFYRASERFFEKLTAGYGRSLNRFMRHRWLAFPIIAIFLAVIGWLWTAIPSEMSPLEDRSSINVSSTASEGTSFDYMNRYAAKVGAVIDSLVPEQICHLDMIGMGNTNRANFNIILKDIQDRKATQQQIANRLTPHISKLTEARSFVSQQQTFGNSRGGLPVQYVIQGQEFEDLREIIPRFMEEVQQSPVFYASDVNLKFTKPELTVSIDRDKASMLGVSVQNIGQTLQLTMSEQRIGYFVANGKQYQIMSQIDRPQRNKPSDLTNIYVRNDYGDLIQLDNLVRTEESSMPPQLYRSNRFLSATVSAGVVQGKTIGDGIAEMDRIAKKVLDERFQTTLTGNSKDFVDSSSNMLFAFGFALILIYLVLAAQFESFRDPMIIMFTVPLTLAGALIALKAFGQTLNIFSEIGIIMLVGLVAKNGILIVEFANQRRQQGLSILEAVQNASEGRLRPILMTSLSTIFGILPMAFATGSGAESRISMGIAVVGGMTFATILTLYVIPAIYSYMTSKKITIIETKNED